MMKKTNNTFVWGIFFICVYGELVKPDHGMLKYALVRLDKIQSFVWITFTICCSGLSIQEASEDSFDPGEWCDFDLNSLTERGQIVLILSEMTEGRVIQTVTFH